jgi:hypothetical protein
LRLTEYLAVDHAKLQLYIGAAAFAKVAQCYALRHPRLDPRVRRFSFDLPKFLGETAPYSRNPELAELASLEGALNAAFEA